MTVTYQLATKENKADLCSFRWEYAHQVYRFDRKEMRAFKKGFRYFLNDELGSLYRCIIAKDGDKIVGTIYWRVIEYMKSYRDPRNVQSAYVRFLDLMSSDEEEIALELIRRVVEICKQENVSDLTALQIKQTKQYFLNSGFMAKDDYLCLTLIEE